MTPSAWDPDQYLQYSAERERPFWDLVAHVPTPSPSRVVDLGCGPGTATAGLSTVWPDATVLGIDSSPAMIEQAVALQDPPRLTFELGDLTTWEAEPGSLDVILSNAALQWVPDHVRLFPRWLASLARRGVLAFQVPGNFGAPSHVLLVELARSDRWRTTLAPVTRPLEVLDPAEYYRELHRLGAVVDTWETTYHHVLTGPDPVLEWARGTALRPYLSVLGPGDARAFTLEYSRALRQAYPPESSGRTLLPFRRVFVVARLP